LVRHTFDVVEEFDSPKGKFSDNFGNVAIADCTYIHDYFSQSMRLIFEEIRQNNSDLDMILKDVEMRGNQSSRFYDLPVIDFCN